MTSAHNRRAWDDRAAKGQRFTQPARDQDFLDPLGKVDQLGWLGGDIRGKSLLCLAAGGGKHGPLYAAAGAAVTVVDLSPAMLELDRQVAAERRLPLRTVEASMEDLSMLAAAEFDIVIHPVSTCYVPDIAPVYREVARVTRGGGLYISQHKSPTSLQAAVEPSARGFELTEPYYREGPLPTVVGSPHREEGTLEYLHRWEDLLGLLCRAGFVIEDFVEPLHARLDAQYGSFEHRSRWIAPYLRLKARRSGSGASPPAAKAIVLQTLTD
ncbi:MAG TPA: class I SAM-dependent methyltransferase [Pirellulaceae bacterium]|nr:class I SAM-dependent methyltransferase [Pirellulaceae bacterium]